MVCVSCALIELENIKATEKLGQRWLREWARNGVPLLLAMAAVTVRWSSEGRGGRGGELDEHVWYLFEKMPQKG